MFFSCDVLICFVNFITPRHNCLVSGHCFPIMMDMFDIFETEYPLRDLWILIFIYRYSLTRGLGLKYRWNSAKFFVEFQKLGKFYRNYKL